MREQTALERLLDQNSSYGHILQQIFLQLDSESLKNIRLASKKLNSLVLRHVWKNSRALSVCKHRLRSRWLSPQYGTPGIKPSAFQCSDDAFDIKIRGETIICGLRNGTVELYNIHTFKKELSLEDQNGSVQVDANDNFVAGVSSDSTVCIWDRKTGELKDVFYHHRASAWGIKIQDNYLITGSMDRTISLINLSTLKVEKHFLAHEDEWGVSDVDSNNEMFISGCFGCRLNVWSFPSCERIHSIKACHPINCVSIEQNPKSANGNYNSGSKTILAATCSRTGRINSFSPNVVLWNAVTGECLKKFDLPSACFVQIDCDKLVTMVAAGDGIIGEHHVIKWPIARILILPRDDSWNTKYVDFNQLAASQSHTINKTGKQIKQSSKQSKEIRGEILLRYQHTPALGCSRSVLVFTQPRTRGMCSVLDFWPTENFHNDNRGKGNNEDSGASSVVSDLSWFQPL